MTSVFQHHLWGYELSYPSGWVHQVFQEADGFAAIQAALQPGYSGPRSGHLLVSAEWNAARQDIQPVWTRHIALLAGMLVARDVGSAPWHMAGAVGLEAEIALPKKENKRLWTGILERDYLLLKMMVVHPLDERDWFEPAVTRIISSLRFPACIDGVTTGAAGVPIPPGYRQVDPSSIVSGISDPEKWQAYTGQASAGALQAFYLREAPVAGWVIEGYFPFPGSQEAGFARLHLSQGGRRATLGILPAPAQAATVNSRASVVVKLA